MHDKLISLMSEKVRLSPTEIDLCHQYFIPASYNRNQIIEQAGKIPRHLYFVVNGYVRLFHHTEAGDEVTTHLNCPPGFITSYINFINQTVSDENVACVTDCDLLKISKPDLDQLLMQSPLFKDFSIAIFNQSLAYNEKRSNELATLPAEQRYRKLIENYPGILHNVPIQYIASFLGIKPESLSRIRKKMAQ